MKGIVSVNNKIVLLKNERAEWELPGGKIEIYETAEQCAIREIKEELNLEVEIESIVDVWMYNILGKVNVMIITYLCKPLFIEESLVKISHEHKEVCLFSKEETKHLNLPAGYKKSIELAFTLKS